MPKPEFQIRRDCLNVQVALVPCAVEEIDPEALCLLEGDIPSIHADVITEDILRIIGRFALYSGSRKPYLYFFIGGQYYMLSVTQVISEVLSAITESDFTFGIERFEEDGREEIDSSEDAERGAEQFTGISECSRGTAFGPDAGSGSVTRISESGTGAGDSGGEHHCESSFDGEPVNG